MVSDWNEAPGNKFLERSRSPVSQESCGWWVILESFLGWPSPFSLLRKGPSDPVHLGGDLWWWVLGFEPPKHTHTTSWEPSGRVLKSSETFTPVKRRQCTKAWTSLGCEVGAAH